MNLETYLEESFWWRWKGEAAYLQRGDMLAKRNEIESLMHACSSTGLPPFGALLLLLGSSQSDNHPYLWLDFFREEIRWIEAGFLSSDAMPDDHAISEKSFTLISLVLARLSQVQTQAQNYCEPEKSKFILRLIKSTPSGSRAPDSMTLEILRELSNAWPDSAREHLAPQRLKTDNKAQAGQLLQALSFLASLDPALFADPSPAPAASPAPKTPPPPPTLSSLLDDPRFNEVGELIRQLLPMLALPLPREQSQEMPVGGVSGIDTRGQPHQLLLSELANDDLLLCARLVHGEAFYQQRERPPSLPPQNRVLLLDSGLRFLGMPRLICAACALAFRLAPAPPPLRIQQNGRFVERSLSSLDEAHEVLQNLDPSLSCAAALKDFLDSASPDTEPILISHHRFLSDAAALDLLRSSPCRRHFLILFDPEGACDIHLWTRLGTKRIGGGKLDLNQVAKARKVKEKPAPKPAPQVELGPLNSLRDPQKLPLFYRQMQGAALWIPLSKCCQPIEIYDNLYTVSYKIIFRLHQNTSLGRLIHFVNYQVIGETDRLILHAAKQQILEQKLKAHKSPTILKKFQRIAFDPRTFMLLNGDIAQILSSDFRWWGKPFYECTEKAEFLWAPDIIFEGGPKCAQFSFKEKLWLGTIPLSLAKFKNYTIYHDRNFGLLHFLPSDQTKPEITLTLSAATCNAMWFSSGEVCGNPDFIIPGNRIISNEEGYQRLIHLLEEK